MDKHLRHRPSWPDEPIVQHLTDTDFYKFTMGQFIHTHFPEVRTTFGFRNRTLNVPLGRIIPERKLREELDHVRTLRYSATELRYLRGTNEYGDQLLTESYLRWLKNYAAPEYDLEYHGDDIHLSFPGPWRDSSPWEIYALEVINELYYRELLWQRTKFERDVVIAEGKNRLWEKVKELRKHPEIVFSEFGTRRRFSRHWQDYVCAMLAEELPATQFRGTSNVYLAQKHDLLPIGTNAHELQMVIAGIMGSEGDVQLRGSQEHILELWWRQYGSPLAIFLPDTFGTESFLRLVKPGMLHDWKGFRQDSGDPIAEGEMWIKAYQAHGIDPREKMMIASDGLDLQTMLKIEQHFRGRLMVSFGWGTNLTNDLGIKALSLVVKATEADNIGLVKLSNNPTKVTGYSKDIERYMRVFGYGEHAATACKY